MRGTAVLLRLVIGDRRYNHRGGILSSFRGDRRKFLNGADL